MLVFAGFAKAEDCMWPFQPRFANTKEKSGFANVIMFLAIRELSKEETTGHLAATSAMYRFLEQGLERRKKKAKGLEQS